MNDLDQYTPLHSSPHNNLGFTLGKEGTGLVQESDFLDYVLLKYMELKAPIV